MENKSLYIKADTLKNINDNQVALLQILCNLEVTQAAMRWYSGKDALRGDLPPHESIICLAIMIASIGEALDRFSKLKKAGSVQFSDKWDQKIKDAWNFLDSPEVENLQKTHLKYIRDKSAFHFDPEPIKKKSQAIANDMVDVPIWEVDELNKTGFSPLASMLIAENIMETSQNKDTAVLTTQVYNAIKNIFEMLILEAFQML